MSADVSYCTRENVCVYLHGPHCYLLSPQLTCNREKLPCCGRIVKYTEIETETAYRCYLLHPLGNLFCEVGFAAAFRPVSVADKAKSDDFNV